MSNSLHLRGSVGSRLDVYATLGSLRATEISASALLPVNEPARQVRFAFEHADVTVDEQTLRAIVTQGQAWLTAFDAQSGVLS